MGFRWWYEDADGEPLTPGQLPRQLPGELPGQVLASEDFPTQSDAESWIGEQWRILLADGVARVSLLEGDRVVYGPMGLDPDGSL